MSMTPFWGPWPRMGANHEGLPGTIFWSKSQTGPRGEPSFDRTLEAMTQNHRRMKFGVNVDPLDV